MTATMRPELPPLPERMQDLPLDDRGYPIPFFVAYVNGKPDFRIMDHRKYVDAVRFKKCWLCGGPLGRIVTFVSGPMCGVNRTSSEPPAHRECARYSAKACPFLTRPKSERREAGMPTNTRSIGGVGIQRNPGVALLWTSRTHKQWADGRGGTLFDMGEPLEVEWLCEGRPATRAEVQHSIDTGVPLLMEIALKDPRPGAVEALNEHVARMQPLLPPGAP